MHNHQGLSQSFLGRGRLSLFAPLFLVFLCAPLTTLAGALLLSPTSGTFTVGSTFDVQILLDTEGKSVNALDVDLRFPPDKLQLVSPNTSVSIISLWTSQPQFNNQTGRVRLQGGIPRGINVDSALVATLTFRVKSVGNAILNFSDQSKVLLNDGLGTDDLRRQVNAVYTLQLPPPAGPVVVSETHPDQAVWYSNPNVILKWANIEPVQSYSYIFDEEPVSRPDDSGEGTRSSVIYKNVPDGKHYFHIKGLREGVWGGITHFGVKVDTDAPAEFPLEILPGKRTSTRDVVVKFATTDTLSGLDHYELKIVSLRPQTSTEGNLGDQSLFIEAESPYIAPSLSVGPYDVFIRAHDKAGNYREIVERLTITDRYISFTSREGLVIGPYIIGWWWLFLLLLLILLLLIYLAVHFKHKHDLLEAQREAKELPGHVTEQLEELRKYKSKYGGFDRTVESGSPLPAANSSTNGSIERSGGIGAGGTLAVFLVCGTLALHAFSPQVFAQQTSPAPIVQPGASQVERQDGIAELAPPYVTTVSRTVSNDEIFYIGGKTETRDTAVIIYTQNLSTGETTSYTVTSDRKGEWFYRHNGFLTPGKYVLWAQAKLGDVTSPPSPQIELSVARAAVVFGVTRVSYEALYLIATIFLLLVIIALAGYLSYHAYHHRRKHQLLLKEVREAEESVKRGFAVIRRDIEREIAMLKKAEGRELTPEEKAREAELYRDLKDTERRIGKEVWDIERVEATK
ncbi:MAG: cohesin domain-containing protein [bacterium]|nr:cohesin domain-containing protein [bacterium]